MTMLLVLDTASGVPRPDSFHSLHSSLVQLNGSAGINAALTVGESDDTPTLKHSVSAAEWPPGALAAGKAPCRWPDPTRLPGPFPVHQVLLAGQLQAHCGIDTHSCLYAAP